MSLTDKQIIGQKGEDLACKFLEEKGFKIIDRNYRKKWGELDIVACPERSRGVTREIRFIEVKTVTHGTDVGYDPEENVHPWKRQRLGRAIQTWLLDHEEYDDFDWQCDVISVYLHSSTSNTHKIDWLEDIEL